MIDDNLARVIFMDDDHSDDVLDRLNDNFLPLEEFRELKLEKIGI